MITQSNTASSIREAAKTVLSGAHERRRGYLTTVITVWNQLALTGTLAIWAFVVRWEALLSTSNFPLFATQLAWAGALSSLLIGIWRLYVHQLDWDIVRLYPTLYISERVLLPADICTIAPPRDVSTVSSADIESGIEYKTVCLKAFGGRGHVVADWVGAGVIIAFALISLCFGVHHSLITFRFGPPHTIGWLLLGNIAGLILIRLGYSRWSRKEFAWPIPKTPAAEHRDETNAKLDSD